MAEVDFGPRYEKRRLLGRGGSSEVWLAFDRHRQEDIAFKLLHDTEESSDLEAAREEFSLLAGLRHPGIVRAYDFGYVGSRPFFTCEFVSGEPLGSPAEARSWDALAGCLTEVCEALAFLHDVGLAHLDVKPSNVLLESTTLRGEKPSLPRTVLIDFGLCRRAFRSLAESRLRGSLPFMGPEYFLGGEVGPRTDVYALGVTMYRVLTGEFPRSLPSAIESLAQRQAWTSGVAPPSNRSTGLDDGIDWVLLKCLAVDPAARFESAIELLEALRRIDGSTGTVPTTDSGPIAKTIGREAETERGLEFLRETLDDAADEIPPEDFIPGVLLLTGEPGVGQSHFLHHLKVCAQTRGFPFYLEIGFPGRGDAPGSILRSLGSHLPAGTDGVRSRFETFQSRLRRPSRSARGELTDTERQLRRAAEVAYAVTALEEPWVLAVDGLQHFDEVSIGLIAGLVRFLATAPQPRPPVCLLLAYREEGPAAPLLHELTDQATRGQPSSVLTLRPFDLSATWELFRLFAPTAEGERPQNVYSRTTGLPAQIIALATRGAKDAAQADARRTRELDLDDETRDLVLRLQCLGRPSRTSELAKLSGWTRTKLRRRLEGLREDRILSEVDPQSGLRGWTIGPLAAGLDSSVDERCRIHADIARRSSRCLRDEGQSSAVEIVFHARRAGLRSLVSKHAPAAARALRETHQNRAALDVYQAAIESLPEQHARKRLDLVLEACSLRARMGEIEPGVTALQELLRPAAGLAGVERARVLLWLGTLQGRAGNSRQAVQCLEEGFDLAKVGDGSLQRDETLLFLNELASLNIFLGNYDRSIELCREGLRIARGSRALRVREVELDLRATLANMACRRFQYDDAIREYEEALELALSLGSPANRAVILNNLGIVHAQCDRYREAIAAYSEALEISQQLEEGPSQLSCLGNLAILWAKVGDRDSADRALADVERLGPRGMGKKSALSVLHARGLALVYCGRYGEALGALDEAVELAEDVGDGFIGAFDRIYAAECRLFLGEYEKAEEALRDLEARSELPVLRGLSLSRRALLHAFLGDADEVFRLVESWLAAQPERPIPFLDAWDRLFLGYALSAAFVEPRAIEMGDGVVVADAARSFLGAAREFFHAHGVRAGEQLATTLLVESRFLRREFIEVGEGLAVTSSPHELGTVIAALLRARLLLESSSKSLDAAERTAVSDLLSIAGGQLIGNALAEPAVTLRALRRASGEPRGRPEQRSTGSAGPRVPDASEELHRASKYWRRWRGVSSVDEGREADAGRTGVESSGESTAIDRASAEPTTSRTANLLRAEGLPGPLVVRSRAMRDLLRLVDRLAGTELPVLIEGELGVGKELIARELHRRSGRAAEPFLVIDVSTIPEPLFEAELFGVDEGVFTGQEGSRQGLLASVGHGTVLLGDIADMTDAMRSRVARVVTRGRSRRLGEVRETRVEARFLFFSRAFPATREKPPDVEDFLQRVRVLSLRVPPLRERREDIVALAADHLRVDLDSIPSDCAEWLEQQPWRGNARELCNLLDRFRLQTDGHWSLDALRAQAPAREVDATFPAHLLESGELARLKEELERDFIRHHLRRLEGDTQALAELLGISRVQLYRRCHRLGLQLREEKKGLH